VRDKAGEGPTRVLVVEDEESYRVALQVGLRAEGFAVDHAADGPEGLRRFGARTPDVVLLDLVLPGMPGVEVCRRMLAQDPTVPVIMVSALDSEADVVVGFEVGAADYVTKPYHLRELVARIQAVLRRVVPPPGYGQPAALRDMDEVVRAGPIVVDLGRREVAVDGRPVHLSRREFDLLACLLAPPGQVRSREELIDRLWAGRDLADSRTLDTHVRRLRMKLERDPSRPDHLRTVRGVGFRFDTELPRSASSAASGGPEP
jgi:two-component system response regulator RegX3